MANNLLVNLELRFAQFQDSLDRATRQADRQVRQLNRAFGVLRGTLASLGVAISVIGFARVVNSAIKFGDEMQKASERIGISVDELTKLRIAADIADVNFKALGDGFKRLSVNAADAARGTGEARDALAALGISVKDGNGQLKTTQQLFEELADAFAGLEDSAAKTALAMKIFGDQGANLIPLFNRGSAAIKQAAQDAEDFGLALSPEQIENARRLSEQFDRVGLIAQGAAQALLDRLSPALLAIIDRFVQGSREGGIFKGTLDAIQEAAIQLFTTTTRERIARVNQEIEILNRQLTKLEGNYNKNRSRLPDTIAALENPQVSRTIARKRQQLIDFYHELSVLEDKLAEAEDQLAKPTETKKKPAPGLRDLEAEAKATADRDIKALERLNKADQDLLQNRIENINRFIAKGQIDINEGFDAQVQLLIERSRREQETFAQEIKKLEELRDKLSKPQEKKQITTRIEDTQAKATEAEIKAAKELTKVEFARADATEAFQRQLKELDAQLAELQGKTDIAFEIRFDVNTLGLRRALEAAGNVKGLDIVNQRRTLGVTQEQFNIKTEEFNRLLTEQQEIESRLFLSQQAGAISELGLLAQLETSRNKQIEKLRETADALDELAEFSGDEKLIEKAEKFRTQVEQLALQADVLAQKFDSIFTDTFADQFAEVIQGTKSLSDAFRDMVNNIVRDITRLVTQSLATKFFKAISSGTGGGAGSGIGEFFASLLGGHSGAVAGVQGTFTRLVSPTVLLGAKRWHAGGVLGLSMALGSTGLLANEVPIIAQRGEGIFTQKQMAKLRPLTTAGFSSAQLNQLATAEAAPKFHTGGIVGDAFSSSRLDVFSPTTINNIEPAQSNDTSSMNVVNNFTIAVPADPRTQAQLAVAAGEGISRALRRNR